MNPDIPSLFAKLELPYACRRGTIDALSSRLESDESALFSALASFGGEGWVCYANGLRTITAPAALDRNLGPILSCELCSGPRSLHVRLEGEFWNIVEFLEKPDGDGWLVGHGFLPSGPAGNCGLLYEVSWVASAPKPAELRPAELRPAVSRFAGFVKSNS